MTILGRSLGSGFKTILVRRTCGHATKSDKLYIYDPLQFCQKNNVQLEKLRSIIIICTKVAFYPYILQEGVHSSVLRNLHNELKRFRVIISVQIKRHDKMGKSKIWNCFFSGVYSPQMILCIPKHSRKCLAIYSTMVSVVKARLENGFLQKKV